MSLAVTQSKPTHSNVDPLVGMSLPAWTYDLDGQPTGVPSRGDYPGLDLFRHASRRSIWP